MTHKKSTCALLCALILFIPLSVSWADEGMWPFNNVPTDEIKSRYGFEVTDAWLNRVQKASVRFNNGGSGSFVSPNGLVLTNHHVASDTLAKLSTAENDYATYGYYAATRDKELKAPDLELNVLLSFEDVTARVNDAVKPGSSPAEAAAARRAEIARIERESVSATRLRSDVVTLYQGGQYYLYRYKQYTDVRLVFAPELAIGFFGGDPDNFNYPRYCLDMALFRVYENDRPVVPEAYFRWSTTGAREGELVFVSGHPGSTARLNTVAHLEFLRDTDLPFLLEWLGSRYASLQRYSRQGEEEARRAQEELLSLENTLKAFRGRLDGLRDEAILERKRQFERSLRRQVASDEKKQKEYGDAWDAIEKARRDFQAFYLDYRFLESAAGLNTSLFGTARTIVRLLGESARPDQERLPEYTDARRSSLELALYSPAPIFEDMERIKLLDSLNLMIRTLGAENALVRDVLAGKSPEARAEELLGGTKLRDVEYRRRLVSGGPAQLRESDDPLIRLAAALDERARAARDRYESTVVAIERLSYAKIARALFEIKGTTLYPDATFTLRLSYGAVKGYRDDGREFPSFTTFAGLYERAQQHGHKFPFELPESWVKRKGALDLDVPFNFVSTNDIVGGNSGSPVINTRAEIVGLAFDGNIQSLLGNFIYDESQNRAISVDSRGMIEALRKIYGASALVEELIGAAAGR